MEENDRSNNQDQPNRGNEPGTAPIIDVQRPVQGQSAPVAAPEGSGTFTDSTDTSTAEAATGPGVGNVNPAEAGKPDPVKQPELMPPKKHGKPVMAIILAIMVAAILAVFTVMAFNKKDSGPSSDQSASQQEDVTPETVDGTEKEVDESLNAANDAQDFPENELNDETLGL